MKQKQQIGRFTSGGISHVIHHEQSFLVPNAPEDHRPQRSIQPIKLDTYEKPPKKKTSKYQR